MIDIKKCEKKLMKMPKAELIDIILVMTKVENVLEKLFPSGYENYIKAATIVAKDEACAFLEKLGASQDEIEEFRYQIEENEC